MRNCRTLRYAAAWLVVGMVWAAPAAAAEDLGVAYLAATCAACHGGGAAGGIPALAGQPADDVVKALAAYRDGTRPNAIMAAAAKGLDDATIAALAAVVTALPAQSSP